jgi:hypothetical protein
MLIIIYVRQLFFVAFPKMSNCPNNQSQISLILAKRLTAPSFDTFLAIFQPFCQIFLACSIIIALGPFPLKARVHGTVIHKCQIILVLEMIHSPMRKIQALLKLLSMILTLFDVEVCPSCQRSLNRCRILPTTIVKYIQFRVAH